MEFITKIHESWMPLRLRKSALPPISSGRFMSCYFYFDLLRCHTLEKMVVWNINFYVNSWTTLIFESAKLETNSSQDHKNVFCTNCILSVWGVMSKKIKKIGAEIEQPAVFFIQVSYTKWPSNYYVNSCQLWKNC